MIGRLLHFDAPAPVRRRFDRHTIEALHRASGGLPSDLNRLAGAIERETLGGGARPARPERATEPGASAQGGPPSPMPRRSPCPLPPVRAVAEPRGEGLVATALALLPHVGLGLGIPLAILALWLWLAPHFSSAR